MKRIPLRHGLRSLTRVSILDVVSLSDIAVATNKRRRRKIVVGGEVRC